MKKHIIAAAVAAAVAVPAMAQNVSLYGILDAGYSDVSREVTQSSGALGAKEGAKGLSFSNFATQRFGFRGTEDLGGGMKANFVVETAIGSSRLSGFYQSAVATSGQAQYRGATAAGTTIDATSVGGRELNASLQMGNTTVKAGFGSTPIRDIVLAYDGAFGTNVIGNVVAHEASTNGNRATGLSVRQQIGEIGLGATAMANSTSLTNTSEVKTGNGWLLNADYNKGPLSVAGARQVSKTTVNQADSYRLICATYAAGASTVTATANAACASGSSAISGVAGVLAQDVKRTIDVIGASYNFGAVQGFAQYAALKWDDSAQVNAAGEGKRSFYSVGARVPFGSVTAFGQYSNGKVEQVTSGIKYDGSGAYATTAGVAANKRDIKGYTIGVKYDMSKRTYGYAAYGETDLEKAAGSTDYGIKTKMGAVGLVHSF